MVKYLKNKFNKNISIYNLIIVFAVSILFVSFITNDKGSFNLLFMINLIISLIMIFKAKISYLSVKNIIVTYTLFPFFMNYNYDLYYGIFGNIDFSFYLIAVQIVLLYNLIWLFILFNTRILEKEKQLLKININIPKKIIYLFLLLAVITTIIRFPSLPFGTYSDRFTSLLPGNFWNHLTILLLVFCLPKLKSNKLVQLVYLFVIIWFLGHYERVDIIGLVLVCTIYFIYNNSIKITFKNIVCLLAFVILLFTSFLIIEDLRTDKKFSIQQLLTKVFVNSTASDVAYVYGCSLDYLDNNELLYGSTYAGYLLEIIPEYNYKNSTINIINDNYYTVGGNFILDEPLINFGIIGIFIFSLVEYILLSLILSKNNKYNFYILAILIFSVFRIVWYGLSYIENTILILLPVFYFVIHILKSKVVLINDK